MGSDLVTTLFVNYQWRRIISEALQLYFDNRIYKLDDADIDDVRNKFQAVINDLYTVESPELNLVQSGYGALLTGSNVTYSGAGTSAIEWNVGTFDVSNPSRIPLADTGYYTIMANFFASRSTAVNWFWSLRKNGTDILCTVSAESQLAVTGQIAWQFDAVADDYVELIIVRANTIVLQVVSFNPRIFVSLLKYES